MLTHELALLLDGGQPRLVRRDLRLEAGVLLDFVDKIRQVQVGFVKSNLYK